MIRQRQKLVIVFEIQDVTGTENDPNSTWFRKLSFSKLCVHVLRNDIRRALPNGHTRNKNDLFSMNEQWWSDSSCQ